jgi:hypothetical protein
MSQGVDLPLGAILHDDVLPTRIAQLATYRRHRIMKMDASRLRRKRYAMPDDIRESLVRDSLLQAYHNRPQYQQNDDPLKGYMGGAPTGCF